MRRFLLIIWILLVSLPLVAQDETWKLSIVGAGLKPAIAIDGNDQIHIAFITEDMVGDVFYAVPFNEEWSVTSVAQGYFYGPVDIASSIDGVAYISYHDHQDTDFVPEVGDLTIARQVQGGWDVFAVDHPGHDGWDSAIVIDTQGNWHAVSIDPADFDSLEGVEYASNAYSLDGFRVEKIGTVPVPYDYTTAIDISDTGIVGVTYPDEINNDMMYAERSAGASGTWTISSVESESNAGRYSSIAFDAAGNPHITYFVDNGQETGSVRYAWRDASGTWQIETIDNLFNVPEGYKGANKLTSLALDSQGLAHVAYADRDKVHYALRSAEGVWTKLIVAESETAEGNVGALVELALDSQDKPHLVFYYVTDFGDPFLGQVVYARLQG